MRRLDFGLQFEVLWITGGKARQQGFETAGQVAPTAGEKRETCLCCASFLLFVYSRIEAWGMVLITCRMGLFASGNLISHPSLVSQVSCLLDDSRSLEVDS